MSMMIFGVLVHFIDFSTFKFILTRSKYLKGWCNDSDEHLWSLELRRLLEKIVPYSIISRFLESTEVRFVCFKCTQEYFKKMK